MHKQEWMLHGQDEAMANRLMPNDECLKTDKDKELSRNKKGKEVKRLSFRRNCLIFTGTTPFDDSPQAEICYFPIEGNHVGAYLGRGFLLQTGTLSFFRAGWLIPLL
jgi:hypothetical protein